MKKIVKAVLPYAFQGKPNFKQQPYNAWINIGGQIAKPHYPPKFFHGMAYHFSFPYIGKNNEEARLRFVEPVSLNFDTFPDYIRYEIIPIIWDCWPKYSKKVITWLQKYHVRSAIFTSSQTARNMQEIFPNMNILSITEGIHTQAYQAGKDLIDRNIDLLEYGSIKRNYFHHYVVGINHINRENSHGCMQTFEQLLHTIADAKITISFPRCDTAPEETGNIETMTQRFWEGMLSRTILLGRAPQELIDLIGYNPVITLNKKNPDHQVRDILRHIEDYQPLVDKNRNTALRLAPWEIRMKQVMNWLKNIGYQI